MSSLPLAFGFANFVILGWLAAAAAPLLIHLWMRRVRKETRWAAVRFLQAAIQRHARRLQLQQWILLALRTALLLLIVLAAAKPVIDSLGFGGVGVRTHRLIVLDVSMSMGYKTDKGSICDRAKRLAREIVDQSRSGDLFSVCTLAGPPAALIAQPTPDAALVKQAIQSAELTESRASLGETLPLIEQMMDRATQKTKNVDRHEIIFFTDLAANTWEALASGASPATDALESDAQTSRRLYGELIKSALISVVDVGEDQPHNGAVIAIETPDSIPTLQAPTTIRAKIARFDEEKAGPQRVELVVEGVSVASQSISSESGAPETVDFSHLFRRAGPHAVCVRLSSDALEADDDRWLAVVPRPYVRVLCVEGRRGAARYVAHAINPSQSLETPLQAEVVSDADLVSIDLTSYDCIFFCNIPQFGRMEAQRIKTYVERGGGAIFFLGDQVLPDRYNHILGSQGDRNPKPLTKISVPRSNPSDSLRTSVRLVAHASEESVGSAALLPVRIDQAVTDPDYRLDPLDYSHPIVAPFRGRERAGLITTPILRYFRMKLESAEGKVAIASERGDPLMVTSSIGRGCIAIVATAGSLASVDPASGEPWTLAPAWPSFLPLVREMVRFVTSSDSGDPRLVGESLSGNLPPSSGRGSFGVSRPDGQNEPVDLQTEDASPRHVGAKWVYQRADKSGVYYLISEATSEPVDAVAANIDPSESDLTRVAVDSLPAEMRLRRAAFDNPNGAPEIIRSTGIHRILLITALVLALLETYLAHRFGRGTS